MIGWLRRNLFASLPHTLVSLACLWLIVQLGGTLVDWAVIQGHLGSGGAAACREQGGACWTLITERHRLMLFGVYPFDQQWRPAVATGLLVVLVLTSTLPRFWTVWLAVGWVVGTLVIALLMWGGVGPLVLVETSQWGGLPLTLVLSVLGIGFAFPLSLLLALGRRSHLPAIKALSVGYIELVRGVPLVSVLFMASVMFPLFLPEGVTVDKVLRALVGITLFTAAYLAEAVRGGLQAIAKGQDEACDALGLTYWQKMRLVILPQALRLVIAPIVNQFIACFKDTSLVTIVGLYDLLAATKAALADPEWRPFFVEGYVAAALVYWCFCFFMSRYSQWLERQLAGR